MKINFDPTLKLSDILTAFSFMLAVAALLYSFGKDRNVAEREKYVQARSIISSSLGQIIRWNDISGSIYIEIQPAIIEASQIWAKSGNITEVRDFIWQRTSSINTEIKRRIIAEKIRTAYIDIYNVDAQLAEKYDESYRKIDAINDTHFALLRSNLQEVIAKFDKYKGDRFTSEMGNALRRVVDDNQKSFNTLVSSNESDVLEILRTKLSGKNSELLVVNN